MIVAAEPALRLLAIGADLMLLAALLAGGARPAMKAALAGLLVGVACYLMNHLFPDGDHSPAERLADLLSLMTPFWAWWFARQLFDRKVGARWLVVIGAYFVACWAVAHYIPALGWSGFVAIHVGALVLVADLIYTALSGLGDDLIEKRRLLRILIPLVVGLQAGTILLYELLFDATGANAAFEIGNSVMILAMILATGMGLLVAEPELLLGEPEAPPTEPARPDLTPQEQVLHDRLMEALADGHHRTPGLTIEGLAEHLGTAEHRLRALINRRLGYRNFSTFLNHHRITEAKAELAERDKVETPILTIAMDLGYNSLATFNRAFRSETGTTPSDFRRDAIGAAKTGQN